MSAPAKPAYRATDYLKYRPLYPDSLFNHLRQYAGLRGDEKASLAVDLGCGSGQATLTLARTVAERVVGIDAGANMIAEGRKYVGPGAAVEFVVSDDSTFTSQFKEHSVDLLTAAEAAHWFSYPDFWHAAHRILKPGGTLALWAYYIPRAVDHPRVSEVIADFYFNKAKCGSYYNAGQEILDDMYASLHPPVDLYEHEERVVNYANELRPEQPFELVRHDVRIEDVLNLLGTGSGYCNWKAANPSKKDIIEEAKERILCETNLTLNSRVTLKWNTVYIFAKAK